MKSSPLAFLKRLLDAPGKLRWSNFCSKSTSGCVKPLAFLLSVYHSEDSAHVGVIGLALKPLYPPVD